MRKPCHICHLNINDKDPAHKLYHQRFHKRYESVLDRFDIELLHYERRENLKRDGRQLINEGKTEDEQLRGAMMVIESYFHRSLDASISKNAGARHPNFAVYIQTIKFSNSLIPKNLMAIIKSKYGHKKSKMPNNETYWKYKYSK